MSENKVKKDELPTIDIVIEGDELKNLTRRIGKQVAGVEIIDVVGVKGSTGKVPKLTLTASWKRNPFDMGASNA